MNITSAQYVNDPLTGEVESIRITVDGDSKKLFVPLVSKNTHYAEILRQVAAGELTIADAE